MTTIEIPDVETAQVLIQLVTERIYSFTGQLNEAAVTLAERDAPVPGSRRQRAEKNMDVLPRRIIALKEVKDQLIQVVKEQDHG